jgi:hypothetical protein
MKHSPGGRDGDASAAAYHRTVLKADDLREYATCDWKAAEIAKREWMAAEIRHIGPSEALGRSAGMDRDVALLRPEGPTPEERDADIRDHVRLSEQLRLAGRIATRPDAR